MEPDTGKEAPTPLMIAITTNQANIDNFSDALRMVLNDLQCTATKYEAFMQQQGVVHHGPYYSIGLITDGIQDQLANVLAGVPFHKRIMPTGCGDEREALQAPSATGALTNQSLSLPAEGVARSLES